MTTERLALALPLLLLLGCPGGGDGGSAGDGSGNAYCDTCDLDHWMPALAANGAIDCGFVRVGESPEPVTACVNEALAEGTPFMARQQLQGIDSIVELGYVVDHEGVLQQLGYDSNVCGAPTCEDGCGPVVSAMECRNPRPAAMPERGLVQCDPGEGASLCEPPAVE